MNALEVLDQLTDRGITATTRGGRLITRSTSGPVDADLAAEIRANKELLVSAIIGYRVGVPLAPCTTCGELSAVTMCDREGKVRKVWPACRMTPGCDGRHEPRPVDIERTNSVPAIPIAAPPARSHNKRFLGPWPAWPSRWPT